MLLCLVVYMFLTYLRPKCMLKWVYRIEDVMVGVLASSAVDRGLEPPCESG